MKFFYLIAISFISLSAGAQEAQDTAKVRVLNINNSSEHLKISCSTLECDAAITMTHYSVGREPMIIITTRGALEMRANQKNDP